MTARRAGYAAVAMLVLAAEVTIAMFVRGGLVRGYVGDSLAVILVYCALMAASRFRPLAGIALALAIATAIELGQWLGLVDALGLQHARLARIALGTSFDPRDLLAYAVGGALALGVEALRSRWSDLKAVSARG